MKPIPLSLGDWVRSYSKGLWQIDRIIHEQYAIRYSLSEPKRLYDGPQVFVRRLVNDKWKVTCARESVHYSFVKKIGAADAKKLAAFIAQNPVAFKRFQEYQKPLDCVL